MNNEVKKDYYESGRVKREMYYKNGKRHRLDGPAYIEYYEDGKVRYEYYFENHNLHRLDGPAEIWYYDNGQIRSEYYYINDKRFFKKQFDSHPQVIEYLENKKFYEIVEEVLGE